MSASIVIPVHDVRPAYFAEAVHSCLKQSWSGELNLVIVDDGSQSSNHRAYLKVINHARRQLPVTLVRKLRNNGLAAARNEGVAHAAGDVVVLLDADDLLAPRCVELICDKLSDDDLDLVYTDHEKRSTDLSEVVHQRRKAEFQDLLERYSGTALDPMLHATFLIHCHGFRPRALGRRPFNPSLVVGDEVQLHTELSRKRPVKIGHIPQILYRYRDNPEGICHSALYPRLVRNIEKILASEMSCRVGVPVRTERIGRCPRTHAALYKHYAADGRVIEAPYVDYLGSVIK